MRFEVLSAEEMAQVIAEASNYGRKKHRTLWVALFVVLCNLGLRILEALRIQWRDVNFRDGEITVTTLKQIGKRTITLPLTKTTLAAARTGAVSKQIGVYLGLNGRKANTLKYQWVVDFSRKEVRVTMACPKVQRDRLPMNDAVYEALMALRNGQPDDAYVFPGLDKKSRTGHMNHCNAWRAFQKILASVGLPRRKLHMLRHSCATDLLERTGDLTVVRDILRHRSISTTSQYLHARNLREKYLALTPIACHPWTARERRHPATNGNPAGRVPPAPVVAPAAVMETEQATILEALRQTEGNRSEAARVLGISVRGLYYKLKRMGMNGHAREEE